MIRAYSVLKDLSQEACKMIKDSGIELTISKESVSPEKEELKRLLHQYDILIIEVKEKMTKDMLEGISNKKIIATLSVGLDHIDEDFFTSQWVEVVNCPKANVSSVAEHIFALILGLKKRLVEANDISVKGGSKADLSQRAHDISGNILGLVGSGKISREVIKIANVFHMKIYCNTLDKEKNKDLEKQGVIFTDLDHLLSVSDIVSVNVPLTKETMNLISKDKVSLMKKNATFINTSRTKVADVIALIKYAQDNPQFYVGLDIDIEEYKEVLSQKRNNVIVTPHIAGVTQEAEERVDLEIAQNIVENIGFLK